MVSFQPDEVAMIAVGIEDLKPGMILERPVKNHQGILLLEAGARISKKNIRILKSWGVTAVIVKGELTRANGGTGQSAPPLKETGQMQLKEKFADVWDDPVMVEIFNAASRQLNKDFQDNGSNDDHS